MEMNNLTSGSSRVPCSSRTCIRNSDPFLDERLTRWSSVQVEYTSPDETFSHFAKGSSCHYVSFFILRQIHSSLLHSGRIHMLRVAKLREQYWLIHAPSAITKIRSECFQSRRHMSKNRRWQVFPRVLLFLMNRHSVGLV